MSDPFVGEIRLFGFPRVPNGWLACNGAPLAIAQYETLFTLIGTTYGGNGTTTFCPPDLRGRVPLHQGTGGGLSQRVIGQVSGEEAHTLILSEMPSHGHALLSTTNVGTTPTPGTAVHLATSSGTNQLYAPLANVPSYNIMAPSITSTGNNLAHDNMMPTLACNFCICWAGIFPSQA